MPTPFANVSVICSAVLSTSMSRCTVPEASATPGRPIENFACAPCVPTSKQPKSVWSAVQMAGFSVVEKRTRGRLQMK